MIYNMLWRFLVLIICRGLYKQDGVLFVKSFTGFSSGMVIVRLTFQLITLLRRDLIFNKVSLFNFILGLLPWKRWNGHPTAFINLVSLFFLFFLAYWVRCVRLDLAFCCYFGHVFVGSCTRFVSLLIKWFFFCYFF